ncbi:MAG: pyridoxal phosphate-dependent aminotransferase, partial [Myxococcales bacterium]|nr:pyridoxal phosphate-dependent aminotransferase [Myxococcales bacterium]
MPRQSEGNPALASLRPSVFSTLVARLARYQGPIFPLHVGDTYLPPPPGSWLEDQHLADEPGLHRYEIPRGRAELLEAISEHLSERLPAVPTNPENVLVTVGATGGLAAAVRALLVPGQKLLLLSPYWPLIRGMSVSHGIETVEIPFYLDVDNAEAAREAIQPHLDPSVGAIYVNWPNNPSGRLSSPAVVRAVLELAEAHDLWVLSDEVYEDYVYSGELLQPGSLPEFADRVIQARS